MAIVQTGRCPLCGLRPELVIVSSHEAERFDRGTPARYAFPNMDAGTRRRMDTGVCLECHLQAATHSHDRSHTRVSVVG